MKKNLFKRSIIAFLLIVSIFGQSFLFILPTQAQVFELATAAFIAAIGGMTVNNVLDHASEEAQVLIQKGEESGNALFTKGGNEINFAIETARLQLGGQMDKTVSELSDENKRLVAALEQAARNAKEIINGSRALKDETVLDLRDFLLATVIPLNKDYFYIQRVDGITQYVHTKKPYVLTIQGTGMGIPTSKLESSINRLLIVDKGKNTKEITNEVKYERNRNSHTVDIIIPNHTLAEYFINDKHNVVELKVEVTYKRPKKLQKKGPISLPLSLHLYPLKAGTLSYSYLQPSYTWNRINPNLVGEELKTRDHHCERGGPPCSPGEYSKVVMKVPFNGTLECPLPGCQKLVKVRVWCEPANYQRCINYTNWEESKLSDDESQYILNVVARSKPVTLKSTAEVYRLEEGNEPTPRKYEEQKPLYYNSPFPITIPGDAYAILAKVTDIHGEEFGFLVDKEEIQPIKNGLLTFSGRTPRESSRCLPKTYYFQVNQLKE